MTIGLVTSLSGIDLPLGADVRLGAQQAVDEQNSGGGIGGHTASLLVIDDRSVAAESATAFGALLASHSAGVIGPLSAAGEEAVSALSVKRRLPLLSTAGTDPVAGLSPRAPGNVFLAAPAASRTAERMLGYAKVGSITALAVAHPIGDGFADAAVAALGAEDVQYGARIVSDQPFDPATVDFSPLIARVRASGAKLLFVYGAGSAPPILERAWKDSGLGIPILFSVASCSTAFLRALSDAGEGALIECSSSVLAPSFPAGSATRRLVDPVAATFQRRNGYYPTQAAFTGYGAARLLLRAIQDAESTDPAKIDTALARLELSTASGPYKFTASDHRGLPTSWLSIAVVKGGKLSPAP